MVLGRAPERRAHDPSVDARRTRMMQRPHDLAEHRDHRARVVGADLGRAGRAFGDPLPRRKIGVTSRELQDPTARPAGIGTELRQQLVVVPAGREDQPSPIRVVTLGRLRRQNAGTGVSRAARVGPVDEQGARARTPELVGGRGTDDPAAHNHGVVRAHRPHAPSARRTVRPTSSTTAPRHDAHVAVPTTVPPDPGPEAAELAGGIFR